MTFDGKSNDFSNGLTVYFYNWYQKSHRENSISMRKALANTDLFPRERNESLRLNHVIPPRPPQKK